MARNCDICGKGPQVGNVVRTRGKAKYLGGVGTKVTGITKRQFKPNLQRVHVTQAGTNKTVLACTQCIRSGRVVKRVRAVPFRLPSEAGSKKGVSAHAPAQPATPQKTTAKGAPKSAKKAAPPKQK